MSNRDFEIVREDLHRRYDHLVAAERIDEVVNETIVEQNATAKLTAFLPIFVERSAAEKLEMLAEGQEFSPRKEILFACERNAGRSQLASAITRHLVGDAVFVRSVGLNSRGGINPTVLKVLEERGIKTNDLYQKEITPRVAHRADVVVLLGIDEIPGVPGDRYIRWDISDPEGASIEDVRIIADQIEDRIRALLPKLAVAVPA
ncbi:low molecular weight phosphatase family protein [Corynebacterium sp. H127]|uniref:arsenate-mycothiol transferase ArsC n=1 Tax=Corynebacterium sp. H127 TaxID=3133418 RepID=UPI003095A636